MDRNVVQRHVDPGLAVALVTVGSAGLVVASVPELRWFLAATLLAGALLAVALVVLRTRRAPPAAPQPGEALGPVQINISRVPISGGVAGLLVAAGGVVLILIGLPEARAFFVAALACGLVLSVLLAAWRLRHPARPVPENTLRSREG